MSYILEALKKADRERSIGDVPDLEAAHWGVRNPPRTAYWPWLVAALLAFNALLMAYLLGSDDAEESGRAEAVSKSSGGLPAEPTLQRVEKPVRDTPREMRPRVNYPAAPVASAPALPRTAARPASQPAGPQPVAKSDVPLAAAAAESPLPEWNELSLEFRSGFPLPHIDVHVYAEEPARRFVLIDLKKYREGDTLGNGAVLEKIAPGSIQLFYQGTRFRVDR